MPITARAGGGCAMASAMHALAGLGLVQPVVRRPDGHRVEVVRLTPAASAGPDLFPRLILVCDFPLRPVMDADKAGHPAPRGITPYRQRGHVITTRRPCLPGSQFEDVLPVVVLDGPN